MNNPNEFPKDKKAIKLNIEIIPSRNESRNESSFYEEDIAARR